MSDTHRPGLSTAGSCSPETPASSRRIRSEESSERRWTSAEPDEPAPTTMMSGSVKHLLGGALERDEAKQAPAAAVAQLMTAHADGRADLDHVLLPPAALDLDHAGTFGRPPGRLALVVLHLEIDPGVRVDPVHFLHDSFEGRVLGHVVVAVRVVRAERSRGQSQDEQK